MPLPAVKALPVMFLTQPVEIFLHSPAPPWCTLVLGKAKNSCHMNE